jgi:CheY-like chemotaxis protein
LKKAFCDIVMMRHILLLEQDREIAGRFQEALSATGSGTVSLVGSMREACQIVTEKPFEAAIIPLTYAGRQANVLKSLRPGLPIIYSSASDTNDPRQYAGESSIQVVHLTRIDIELQAALATLTSLGQKGAESNVSDRSKDLSNRAGLALLKNLIRTADLGKKVRQVVLSHGGQLIAFGGYQSKMHAHIISNQINETWEGEEESVQIQFIQLADVADPIMLYTRLAAGLLLTLAAVPEISKEDAGRITRPPVITRN